MESKRYAKACDVRGTLFQVLRYLRFDMGRLLFVIFAAIVNVGCNLTGTSLLRPLIDRVIAPIDGSAPRLDILLYTVLAMIVCYTVSFVLGIFQTRMMITVSQNAVERMRNDLFEKLQKLPVSFFDTKTHGEIMSRFTNDLDLVNDMLNNSFLEVFTSLTIFVGLLFFMFFTSWLLTLVALFFIPILLTVVRIFTKKARSSFEKTQQTLGEMNGFIEETLSGQKIVKCFSKENDMEKIFDDINKRQADHSYRSSFFSSLNIPVVNNINNLNYVICIVVGAIFAFGVKNPIITITVGQLGTFIAFTRQFNRPMNRITNQLNVIQASLAGAERMFEIMAEPNELALDTSKWWSNKAIDGQYSWTDGQSVRPVSGEVRFEDVSFSYVPGQLILKHVSLYAKPGQKIAFVGSTGAGKTTVTNLLTRFYDIDSGRITIDGIDLREIDRKSMRKSMTLVLQDTHLFSGTIIDNIRYGRLKATDEECVEAARIAKADSFIRKLPQGYQTVISGANDSLSQGQRQLLTIARCAVANPPILILDEATSSIDTRTEKYIEAGLDELMKGKTTFVIAHRLSTIRNADAILVLEHGEIIERGNHEQLLEQKGRYYALCTGKFELK